MVSVVEIPEKMTSPIIVNQPEPIQKPEIERGMIEVLSDLQNRPEWARIPIVGILEILGPEP